MIEKKSIFDEVINEIHNLWVNNLELSNFVKWPKDLCLSKIKSNKVEVTNKLSKWKRKDHSSTSKIHNLISTLSPYVNWEKGYDEKEVGKKFLKKYGFFELIGPTGHFLTSKMGLYVNFLDSDTCYPWHNHEAEELYFVISGEAKFESKNEKSEILKSTNTRFHKSYQPHSITTTNEKILTFVIWKNKYENISKIVNYKNF